MLEAVGGPFIALRVNPRVLTALPVLLLLREHGSFVSYFATVEANDWKERKVGLQCRQLLPDLPVWASGALVSILLALVTLDLALLRSAFNFVGLSSQAWCSCRV